MVEEETQNQVPDNQTLEDQMISEALALSAEMASEGLINFKDVAKKSGEFVTRGTSELLKAQRELYEARAKRQAEPRGNPYAAQSTPGDSLKPQKEAVEDFKKLSLEEMLEEGFEPKGFMEKNYEE